MKTRPNPLSIAMLTVCLIGIGATAHAGKPQDLTDAEWALLPSYCPYTMSNPGHTPENIRKWEPMIGPGFFHLHHYCWGLATLNRANRAAIPRDQKGYKRHEALGDLWYVGQEY